MPALLTSTVLSFPDLVLQTGMASSAYSSPRFSFSYSIVSSGSSHSWLLGRPTNNFEPCI